MVTLASVIPTLEPQDWFLVLLFTRCPFACHSSTGPQEIRHFPGGKVSSVQSGSLETLHGSGDSQVAVAIDLRRQAIHIFPQLNVCHSGGQKQQREIQSCPTSSIELMGGGGRLLAYTIVKAYLPMYRYLTIVCLRPGQRHQ